jgi:hypothetical protein
LKQLFFLFLFTSTILFAQEKNCGSNLRLNKYYKTNPEAKKSRLKLENQTTKFQIQKGINTTIPVVVHIVYKNGNENISNAQIQSQLDVLNEDFTRTNADAFNTPADFLPIVSNTQVNFCLAQQSPNGNPTNGIIRKQTTTNFFPLFGDAIYYDSLGGSTAWNTQKYLNIWVAEIESGILGWAQFPAAGDTNTDGVVIDFEHFGTTGTAIYPYDLGRTATHEVGHWFNLYHIWGDNSCGNDYVNDTPIQEQGNFGCKIHPYISCSNTGDMFMNFMDYTNDACMNSFTEGQKDRIWSSISNWRTGLLTSNGCVPTTIPNSDAGIISIIEPNNQNTNCASPIYPKVVLKNYGLTNLNSVTIKYNINNNNNIYYSWNGDLQTNEQDTILLSALSSTGTSHLLNVSTQYPNNSADINPSNDKESIIFSSINGEQVQLNFMTDNYALETSWVLLDDNNNIIDSGDSLTNNTLYQSNYCLAYECYKFVINDSQGDGFCCNFGNGSFTISSSIGNNQYAQNAPFTFTDTSYFCLGNTTIAEKNDNFKLHPNPTNGNLWINDNLAINNTPIFARILNNLGQTVLSTRIVNNKIDLSRLNNGVYQILIETDKKQYNQKIIINK